MFPFALGWHSSTSKLTLDARRLHGIWRWPKSEETGAASGCSMLPPEEALIQHNYQSIPCFLLPLPPMVQPLLPRPLQILCWPAVQLIPWPSSMMAPAGTDRPVLVCALACLPLLWHRCALWHVCDTWRLVQVTCTGLEGTLDCTLNVWVGVQLKYSCFQIYCGCVSDRINLFKLCLLQHL